MEAAIVLPPTPNSGLTELSRKKAAPYILVWYIYRTKQWMQRIGRRNRKESRVIAFGSKGKFLRGRRPSPRPEPGEGTKT